MRYLVTLIALCAGPAAAEVRSTPDCLAAVAADPQAAREAAAQWAAFGGGAEARACEARALEALGARRTAATILTEIAADRGNGLAAPVRAGLLHDAGRLWLLEREPGLARAVLDAAAGIATPDADVLALHAEALGRLDLWAEAVKDLDLGLALEPGRPDLLALRAAARRKSKDAAGGLGDAEAALAILPHLPEALFEKAACLAVLGRVPEALDTWFRLIELHPDSELAALARRNIRSLAGN